MASSASALWKGRPVRVVDGTGVSMPDTEENRESFSQPSGQQPGCGFPGMNLDAMQTCGDAGTQ